MLSITVLLASLLALHAWTCAAVPHNASYPLGVSDNGRRFITPDGQPFFWQADTAWALFHRSNLTEATTYLDDRASKGFNMVLVVGVSMFGPADPNRFGELPLVDFDITQPNEAYWTYVDQVYTLAWERGIRIALVPAWGYYIHESNNVPGDGNVTIDTTNAYAFGKWFGDRYPDSPKILVADTNPYWTNKTAVSADYTAGGVPQTYAFTDYGPVYDQLAKGLQQGDSLITIHPTNQWFSGGPIATASAFFDDRDWLTFDACQSGHADYAPNPPIPWWNARRGYEPVQIMYGKSGKIRPVLDNEAHYEARYDNGKAGKPYWNASNVRIGSFQAAFSGSAGVTYGADNVMQWYIPGLYTQDGSGPARSWSEDIQLPGSSQIQNIRKVLTDRKAYPNLVPDPTVIIGDAGRDDNRTMALRAEDNSALIIYTPTGAAFKINVSCLPDSPITASWFDPLDGSYTSVDASLTNNASFVPPTNSTHLDWVLVLET